MFGPGFGTAETGGWLLAANNADWTKLIVVGIAILIYAISALAKQLGAPPQAPELANRESPPGDDYVRARRASGPERERFAEEQRRRRKPAAPKQALASKAGVGGRHLHSELEERHVEVHVSAESRTQAPGKRRPVRRDAILAAMLSPKRIGRAFVLGQVLQPPIGLRPPESRG